MSAPKCPKCGRLLTASEYGGKLLECSLQNGRVRHGDDSFYRLAPNGRLKAAKEPADPGAARRQRMTDTVADRWTPDMARSSILGRKS